MSQATPPNPGPVPDPSSLPVAPPAAAPKGHPKALWFFFWGEFAERASYYGMRAIIPLYLNTVLNYSEEDSGTIYYWFKMAAYFLPLVGGYIADRWLGRYWTIVGFSIPYVAGHFVLGIEERWACLFAMFFLLAPGSGVIKPNISSLLGQTYDQQRPGQEGLRNSGFQWFYMAINIGALISMLMVPILRDSFDYATAFKFPAWLMVVALAIFALGKPFYAKEERIVTKVTTPEERAQQRAALIRLLGVFGLIILWWFAYEQNDSIWVFFGKNYMDHSPMGFNIPSWLPKSLGGGTYYEPKADAYQVLNALFVVIFVPVFNVIFRKIDPDMKVITPIRKILAGFLLTAACTAIMMCASYLTNGGTVKVSAWWLVFSYVVLTAGEVLLYGTMLDLSYAAAPKSMKGFITACFLVTNTLGNFINSFFVQFYGKFDAEGKLNPTQYLAVTIVMVLLATVAFYFVGKRFERGQQEAAAA